MGRTRLREERRSNSFSRPRRRAHPSTAATWPKAPGAKDAEGVSEGGKRDAALEQDAESLDELVGPLGQVGEGSFLDLAVFAEGLAEEDGGR